MFALLENTIQWFVKKHEKQQNELVELLQKETKAVESEIEKNRDLLKTISSQTTVDAKSTQIIKIKNDLINLEKSIKEKEAYKDLQKDEFLLKTKIIKKLESDLVEGEKDIEDCLSQEEENNLKITIQKISIKKKKEKLDCFEKLKSEFIGLVFLIEKCFEG